MADTSTSPAGDLTGNNLLRALRAEDLAILEPFTSDWHGSPGSVLYEPGDNVRYVYFPCGPSLVSYLVVLEEGLAIETTLIGREGAVGGIVSQGSLPAYARAEVQYAGSFKRIPAAQLEDAKMRSIPLRHLFARYADCLMAQVFQSVGCNAAHSIEQRAVKWLVAAMDRTGGTEIPLTHEQLAAMLGVGRSYISRLLQSLRARSMLDTRRGSVVVKDMEMLRSLACGCNRSVKRHFDEVLKGVYPQGSDLI